MRNHIHLCTLLQKFGSENKYNAISAGLGFEVFAWVRRGQGGDSNSNIGIMVLLLPKVFFPNWRGHFPWGDSSGLLQGPGAKFASQTM